MTAFYVANTTIKTAPNDANDGKDRFGFAITGGTWTASAKALQTTGSFSGYTQAAGDIIWISSATAGTDGWYKIASKDSDNQLTLGDLVEGSGITTDQTDVASSTGPWATLAHANTTASTYDPIIVCDGGDYEISATLATGVAKVFIGGNERGVLTYTNFPRIVKAGSFTGDFLVTQSGSAWNTFAYFELDGGDRSVGGISTAATSGRSQGAKWLRVKNCGTGIYVGGGSEASYCNVSDCNTGVELNLGAIRNSQVSHSINGIIVTGSATQIAVGCVVWGCSSVGLG